MEAYRSGDEDDDEEEMKVERRYKRTSKVPKKIEYISGKRGARYKKYCAFSIQPQNYPSAIHYVSIVPQ